MALKLVTGPTVEPVSLEEAKLHLRVDVTDDDNRIRELIRTARADVETMCLHALITQTWDLFMDEFPGDDQIELPLPPLQSVTGVYYTPEGASEATFAATNYTVDTYNVPGKMVLKSTASWPADTLEVVNGVRIRFVCGFGADGSYVDPRAVQAMMLLIGHYYEHREEVISGQGIGLMRLPLGVAALVTDLRMKVIRY
jgi:uncharacterized phiE125 gp8 family phage protein